MDGNSRIQAQNYYQLNSTLRTIHMRQMDISYKYWVSIHEVVKAALLQMTGTLLVQWLMNS